MRAHVEMEGNSHGMVRICALCTNSSNAGTHPTCRPLSQVALSRLFMQPQHYRACHIILHAEETATMHGIAPTP